MDKIIPRAPLWLCPSRGVQAARGDGTRVCCQTLSHSTAPRGFQAAHGMAPGSAVRPSPIPQCPLGPSVFLQLFRVQLLFSFLLISRCVFEFVPFHFILCFSPFSHCRYGALRGRFLPKSFNSMYSLSKVNEDNNF